MSASDGILSKDGYRFIKGYEGFASYPCYFNGESFKTYGYGITELYQPVYYAKLGSPPCTEKLASEVYGEMVINNFGKPLAEQMKRDGVDLAKVPINKFDSFVSLSMNAGLGGCTSSPMYKKFIVNINDESIATDWLTYATNGGLAGLVARRKAESDIFKSGVYEHRPIIKYDHNGNISGVVEGDGYIPPIFGDGGTAGDGNKIVESARKMIGKPYRWGGNYPPINEFLGTPPSDGTDCSGLVQWAYNDSGYPLDNKVRHTTYTLIKLGRPIYGINNAKAGDLLFNDDLSHVQIYTGNNTVIEAQQDGVPIKESNTWMAISQIRRIVEGGEEPPTDNKTWFFKYGVKPLRWRTRR